MTAVQKVLRCVPIQRCGGLSILSRNVRLSLTIFLAFCALLGFSTSGLSAVEESHILDERQLHPTKLTAHKPADAKFDNTVPSGWKLVHYRSGDKQLVAWMAIPSTPGPHPAIVFAHGGFALNASYAAAMVPFLKAGYAVLLPSWRGENGNPGSYEMCFGEADDAVAAIDFMSEQPGIDKNRIFAGGHSVGATIMMLAAEMSPKLKKVGVSGGFPDMFTAGQSYGDAPFNDGIASERLIRSPGRFVGDLKCPLLLCYGGDEHAEGEAFFLSQAKKMQTDAAELKKSVKIEVIPKADHFSALPGAISKMLAFFGQP